MGFDPLSAFALWFLDQQFMQLSPAGVYDFGDVRSVVLYRSGAFQAELFIVKPGGKFPDEHRHPNVDSYEVHVWGDIPLFVNGQPAAPIGLQCLDGRTVDLTRVRETDWHGAEVFVEGGAFLSLQYWLNGIEPTSVGLDWEGNPVSTVHELGLSKALKQKVKDSVRPE